MRARGFCGHRRTQLLTSTTHLAEIRELEAQLDDSLLALDYAEKHHEPLFAAAARVAAIQQRLNHLRGSQVTEIPKRRAAWLAHFVRTGVIDPADDGRSVMTTEPMRSPTRGRRHKPTPCANVVFPVID